MTTTNLRTTILAAAAASLALLGGCGTTSAGSGVSAASAGSVTIAAPSTTNAMGSAAGAPVPAAPTGPHQQADVTFAQQMTVHHRAAIAMADLAATRSSSVEVKTLAAAIKAAQGPELTQMTGWLAAWAPATDMNGMPNTSAAAAGAMGGMSSPGAGAPATMTGLMSDAQMSQLTAAKGPTFDKLFLQMMIVHHQGAVTMAHTEIGQGVNPAAKALAQSIITSQGAQISQMNTMLAGR